MTYLLTLDSDPSGGDAAHHQALTAAVAQLLADLGGGDLRALSIAREIDDLDTLRQAALRMSGAADDIVVLGMGGSSLAGQALVALRGSGKPAIRFFDNIDPRTWLAGLAGLDLSRTHFLVISKSGGTAETLAQCLLALDLLGAASLPVHHHMTVVVQPGESSLRALAGRHNLHVLDHPGDVGGRFSALTLVGLLPALLAGLDIGRIRGGACAVLDDLAGSGIASAPARGALALVVQESRGIGVQALMPYGDILLPLARWWVQLWGESLGKDGKGSTPLAARGVTDQHSQLQLWRDGTHRHMVTVLAAALPQDTAAIATCDPELAYLHGHTLGELFQAEQEATCETLRAAGVPLRRFDLERVDEETMGALFAHFMIETILAAHMIGVDPFGQPAVEDGKQRARDKLRALQA